MGIWASVEEGVHRHGVSIYLQVLPVRLHELMAGGEFEMYTCDDQEVVYGAIAREPRVPDQVFNIASITYVLTSV